MLATRRQRGDTIIEVVMAFAVFSMLAIGTLMLMNQGTQAAQYSLEITQTQKTIAAQKETLQYLRDNYMIDPDAPGASEVMRSIIQSDTYLLEDSNQLSEFGNATCNTTLPTHAFVLDPENPTADLLTPIAMNDATAPAFPRVSDGAAYGVWIEAVRGRNSVGSLTNFVDFHIRSCWQRPTGSGVATTGTILRLYMPL